MLSGTSFAAPVVAGMAADVLGLNPQWTPDQVKGALMVSAKPVRSAKNNELGVGEVNLKAALVGLDARIETGGAVLVIAVPDETAADEAASRLERVFGFAAASVCLRCERDVEQIADVAMLAFERRRPASFAVRVRRRDKSFPLTSQDLERLTRAVAEVTLG